MKLLIAAGGTGGHIFPALALAEELRRRDVTVVWAGRQQGLERDVAVEHGFDYCPVPSRGFLGKNVFAKAVGLLFLLRGTIISLQLLRSVVPDGVVAAGGFTAAAVLSAAVLTRTPFFLLEQNCVPGRVTRFFSRWARETFLAFPTERQFPWPHSITGNPLRKGFKDSRTQGFGHSNPRILESSNPAPPTVLVLGGSLGARALSIAAVDAAAALTNLDFILVTGRRDFDFVRSRVRSKNIELVEFAAQPELLYERATIAVSRAGGMALSELAAFGIPAVLVPFPFAADRHQDANARHMASVGAALVLDQNRLSGLTSLVHELVTDVERREATSRAALQAARPDAAAAIAERVLEATKT